MSRVRINALIVDDSRMERHHLSLMLRHLGVNSDHANDVFKANFLTEVNEYDIILVNAGIMGEKPKELVKSLLALPSVSENDIPIIQMNNRFFDERIEGCRGYLEKPVTAFELRSMLIELLPDAKAGSIECIAPKEDGQTSCQLLLMIDEGSRFDTKAGMRSCGTLENYLSAVKIFYDTIESKADEIESLFEKKDIPGYTIKVHALKSSAGLIGALVLSDMARRLEDAGKAGDTETIERDTAALLEAYRSIGDKFAAIFEEESDDDKPLADDAVVADAFASLKEFADAMDFDLAKMVLDSLEEFSFKEEDAAKIKKINDCLLQLDWDGITAVLA